MNVLLADDHRLLLEGLSNLLEAHHIQVAGMAKDGLEAIQLARLLHPDVILMDIRMPHCSGLEATRRIKAEMPDMKIIILTTSTEDQDLFEAVKSGACGYLLKSMDADELVESLNLVQQGTPPFSPGLAERLLGEFARLAGGGDSDTRRRGDTEKEEHSRGAKRSTSVGGEAEGQGLTERQREVLELVAQGLSYKEIGARLHLSPRTVKYHMAEIMNLLHLEHRAQVLAYAGKSGMTFKEE
jgi:two-component system NarL family response regulator